MVFIKHKLYLFGVLLSLVILFALGACRGVGNDGSADSVYYYNIGGEVSGLSGQMTLQLNGSIDLPVSMNGLFVFSKKLEAQAVYSVSISKQPGGEFCAVSNNIGYVHISDISSVSVQCSTLFSLAIDTGVKVDGITSNPIVSVNIGQSWNVWYYSIDGGDWKLGSGDEILLTMGEHTYQVKYTDVSGIATISGVMKVKLVNACSVSGTVVGNSDTVRLTNNGIDATTVAVGGGSFSFTAQDEGTDYLVGVEGPISQICKVSNAAGSAIAENISNVEVVCSDLIYTVSTFAGSGVSGYQDGQGEGASFSVLSGIAIDSYDNLYVSDGNRIRKITATGLVTTLAGSDVSGYMDGSGIMASFNYPFGVAVDSSGNVYVADLSNARIRKITPSGLVTTFAGSGVKGYADGQDTVALFDAPHGIVFNKSGDLYVSDVGNHRIRKITPNGLVTTFSGSGLIGNDDGVSAAASFTNGYNIAYYVSSNSLYLAEAKIGYLRKVTAAGQVSTLIADSEVNSFCTLCFEGIAVDKLGYIYLSAHNVIYKVSNLGSFAAIAGSTLSGYHDGIGASASFNGLGGIAIDSLGHIYVLDVFNYSIRRITVTE